MCEIAILNPRRYSADEIAAASMELYSAMGSSLGVVFMKEANDGTKFRYDMLKSLNPDMENVQGFIEDHMEESIRCFIHGRLATHGAETIPNCHPIDIECDSCDVDMVMHNGVVYQHRSLKKGLEAQGHDIQTPVDTELIAHKYSEVPDDFDIDVGIGNQPAYILFNEDRAYINVGGRYRLTERGTMALPYRTFGPDRQEDAYAEVILTPTNAE